MLGLYILGVGWQHCTGADPPATARGRGYWREDAGGRWSRQREVMITRSRGRRGVRREKSGGGRVRPDKSGPVNWEDCRGKKSGEMKDVN